MPNELSGWALLHSALPKEALKPLHKSVYGVAGLTDVNEGYLIERLWQSGLSWGTEMLKSQYLGHEDREVDEKDERGQKTGKKYLVRYYMHQIDLRLTIDGKNFDASGAHDNRRLDAAMKGARTVAFKACCKEAGMTIELFKDGKAMDVIYDSDREGGKETEARPAPTVNDTPAETSANGKIKVAFANDEQKEAVRYLVNSLEEGDRKHAEGQAVARMKQAAVRGGNSQDQFEAAATVLFAIHEEKHGPDCVHVRAVKDKPACWQKEAA